LIFILEVPPWLNYYLYIASKQAVKSTNGYNLANQLEYDKATKSNLYNRSSGRLSLKKIFIFKGMNNFAERLFKISTAGNENLDPPKSLH